MRKLILLLSVLGIVFAGSCSGTTKNKENTGKDTTEKSEAIHLTKKDFIDRVMDFEKNKETWVYKGDKPCVIDFYADWCPPCRMASPILEELAKEYKGKIYVYKINVDQEQELAAMFGIQGIPAFLYCPMKGNPTMNSGIGQSKEETKDMFKKNIDSILLK
ncbi:MAG: thioredoxin domain-containing protein [Bacteroidota bacterium]|nr:thioredoxin domain-containing protein [Bacteroidota bacterium]